MTTQVKSILLFYEILNIHYLSYVLYYSKVRIINTYLASKSEQQVDDNVDMLPVERLGGVGLHA